MRKTLTIIASRHPSQYRAMSVATLASPNFNQGSGLGMKASNRKSSSPNTIRPASLASVCSADDNPWWALFTSFPFDIDQQLIGYAGN